MLSTRTCIAAAAASVVLASAGTAAVAAPAHGIGRTAKLTASASALSRFYNGSFESPAVAPNRFREFTAGQFIGPWHVTRGSVDLIGVGYWQAAEGNQSLDLNGSGAGSVSQTITTVLGKTYTVTYALAGNIEAGPTVKTGKVLIDGQDIQDFSFNTAGKTHANMGYIYRQVTFVAANPSTRLTLASTTYGSPAGPVIDDVSVKTCPPCPSCG